MLRHSARQEFEAARFEPDPEIVSAHLRGKRVAGRGCAATRACSHSANRTAPCPPQVNRLLVVGRDALHQVAERFLGKRQQMQEDAEAAWRAGGLGPPPVPP